VPEYKYREYVISIATLRVGPAIKVDTEISLSPDSAERAGTIACGGSMRLVPIGPLEEVLNEALRSAKFTADVLAARAVGSKGRRLSGIT
jgi:hypothetical protein